MGAPVGSTMVPLMLPVNRCSGSSWPTADAAVPCAPNGPVFTPGTMGSCRDCAAVGKLQARKLRLSQTVQVLNLGITLPVYSFDYDAAPRILDFGVFWKSYELPAGQCQSSRKYFSVSFLFRGETDLRELGTNQIPLAGSVAVKETKESGTVSAYQLEGHVKDQLPVSLRDAPEKLTQPLKKRGGFAGLAPLISLEGSAFRQGRYFGPRVAVVEQLVHRNFEGARQLFKRLDARDGVAVLDSGNVATLQASALLNVPLR